MQSYELRCKAIQETNIVTFETEVNSFLRGKMSNIMNVEVHVSNLSEGLLYTAIITYREAIGE